MAIERSSGKPNREATLLRRAREGDDAAFEELFEPHAMGLAVHVRQLLPAGLTRKVSVADVVQEVRITAHRRIDSFEPQEGGSFRAWIREIARNHVGNLLKRYLGTRRRAAVAEVTKGQRPATEGVPGRALSPSGVAMVNERARTVRDLLNLMPEDYRRVLELVFHEQLSLRDAGDRLDRSREATKKLYARAMRSFTELAQRTFGDRDGQ